MNGASQRCSINAETSATKDFMATQTLKTDTKVTIKETQQKGVIIKVEKGRYFLEGMKTPYFAHEIKATPIIPAKKQYAPINPFSPQRQKLNAIYSILSRQYMPHNKTCTARFAGCTHKATEIHHRYKRTGFYLIMTNLFLPICRNCHQYATTHSKEAIAAGVSVSRMMEVPYSFTNHEKNLLKVHNVSPPA
jgi:hypothetical protein